MLASRGFVYASEQTARHAHPGCDCRVVPGFAGETTVEGYDLDGLYRRYVKDLADGKLNVKSVSRYSSHVVRWGSSQFASYSDFAKFVSGAVDIEDLQLRCAVIEQEWGKTGLSDRYYSQLRQSVLNKRSDLMGDAVYEKPRAALEDHEKKGVDWLLRNGIRPTVKQEDPKAPANIDFEIDGQLWEMKNVTNNRSSVSNQLSRGRKKWYKLGINEPARFIVTCEECSDSFESVCIGISERLQAGERCIVLSKEGLMTMLP